MSNAYEVNGSNTRGSPKTPKMGKGDGKKKQNQNGNAKKAEQPAAKKKPRNMAEAAEAVRRNYHSTGVSKYVEPL